MRFALFSPKGSIIEMTAAPLVEERIVCRQTTLTVLTDCAAPRTRNADRLILLMLHGALRSGRDFLPSLAPYRTWADLLIPDLPGNGASEFPLEAGIGALADEIASLVRRRVPGRRVILVGESLGGLVALRCCDGRLPAAAIVLLDPPLSMAKQWVVQFNAAETCKRTQHWYHRTIAQDVFGLDPDSGYVQERLYYGDLAALAAPCLIISGDTPLFPVWHTALVPNCFDEVDELIVRSLKPSCRIERLSECGHRVFLDGGERCHNLIRRFVCDALNV